MEKANFLFTKKFTAVGISALLVFCSASIAAASTQADDVTDFTLNIVHTNDIHARVQESERNGIIGAERLGKHCALYYSSAHFRHSRIIPCA